MSIACDGVCLTLVSINKKILQFYLSKETIKRSKFKYIKIGDHVNLELPLKFAQKISGHICVISISDLLLTNQSTDLL